MTSALCPLGFQVSSPAWQAAQMFLYESYEERVFTSPAAVVFTQRVGLGSTHLCTPLLGDIHVASLSAF